MTPLVDMDCKDVEPQDALIIKTILEDMGVSDYEPRVVNHLMEFAYRYATDILEDAKVFSVHAGKRTIDVSDLRLAASMYTEQHMTTPPLRELLAEVAELRNSKPLPNPRQGGVMGTGNVGGALRLPADRYCLTACNYRLKMSAASNARSAASSSRSGFNGSVNPPLSRSQPGGSSGVARKTSVQRRGDVDPNGQSAHVARMLLQHQMDQRQDNNATVKVPVFRVTN